MSGTATAKLLHRDAAQCALLNHEPDKRPKKLRALNIYRAIPIIQFKKFPFSLSRERARSRSRFLNFLSVG